MTRRADEVATFAQVGDMIWTPPCGEWPGGYARITELTPDPGAPEIVFQVEGVAGQGEIGVFAHEEILTLTRHGP